MSRIDNEGAVVFCRRVRAVIAFTVKENPAAAPPDYIPELPLLLLNARMAAIHACSRQRA